MAGLFDKQAKVHVDARPTYQTYSIILLKDQGNLTI